MKDISDDRVKIALMRADPAYHWAEPKRMKIKLAVTHQCGSSSVSPRVQVTVILRNDVIARGNRQILGTGVK
jgi:hypothetical protein